MAALLLLDWRPRAAGVKAFVVLAGVCGGIGAMLFAATFWVRGRVGIGRMKLRYKVVRRGAALAGAWAIAAVAVWRIALWRTAPPAVKPKLVVLIARLGGDSEGRLESRIEGSLRELARGLPLEVRQGAEAIASRAQLRAPAEADAGEVEYLQLRGAGEMLWGDVSVRNGQEIARLYETNMTDGYNYGRTFEPADFALPQVRPEQAAPLVDLMFATILTELPQVNRQRAVQSLSQALTAVEILRHADAANWDAEIRARVEFMLGKGYSVLADRAWDVEAACSGIYYYLCAFDGWRGAAFAGERVMTLRHFAEALPLFGSFNPALPVNRDVQAVLTEALAEDGGAPAGSRDRAMIELALGDSHMASARDNDGFAAAMESYQKALAAFPKDRAPILWAYIEYQIACAEATMGRRDADTTRLLDSMRLLDDVFSIRTRGAMPYEWAVTQATLGEIQLALADRLPTEGYDAQAVSSERAALEVLDPDDTPYEWSRAQELLGGALAWGGEHNGARDELQQAVSAMRAGASSELRRRAPGAWAETQLSLATALESLAELEWRKEAFAPSRWRRLDADAQQHFEESVAAAREGLDVATEDGYRLLWATLQSMLGRSLERIGEREVNAKNPDARFHLEQAIEAQQAALRVLSPSAGAVNWADAESLLGDSLAQLGQLESNLADLRAAVAAYRASATVETREKYPDEWRINQHSLAIALVQLGNRELGTRGAGDLDEAISDERELLKTVSPDNDLEDWLDSSTTLAAALKELGRRESGVGDLEAAAAVYRDEMQHLSAGQTPELYQEAAARLSQVNSMLAARGATG